MAIEDTEEKGRRRRELMRMNEYNLVREGNMARNKELLASLGLDKSFNEVMGIGTKRKAAAKAVGQRKRGTRELEKGNSSEDDSEDEPDVPAAPRPPRPVRAAALKTGTTAAATPSKTWVEDRERLETTDLGEAFTALVQRWWDYEAGSGFVSQVCSVYDQSGGTDSHRLRTK
jgi:hypothetical protein